MLLLAVIFAALPVTASAETFFQWTDAAGVVHFTNLQSEVPKDQAAVQVVVDAAPSWQPTASEATVSDPPVPSINRPLAVGGSSPWPATYAASSDPYECGWPEAYECGYPYFYPGVAVGQRTRAPYFGQFHAGPLFSGGMRSVGHSRGRR